MADVRIVTVTLNPAMDRVIEAPNFSVGSHIRGKRVALYPAGKGVLVSRVLAAIGVRSIATGFVGQGELALFEEHLERVGQGRIVCQLLVVRGRTRDNTTIVDPINETETHLRDLGFEVRAEDVKRVTSKVSLLAHEGAYMLFCGSSPPGLSPEAFADMLGRCRAQGARVAIDTSGAHLEAMRGRPIWMAKLNTEELATLSGMPTKTEEEAVAAARSLCVTNGGSVEFVVATRGANGAFLIGRDVELLGRVAVHPGRVISSVGCGDSLMAGLIEGWVRSGDWTEAMRMGLAVATANAVTREAGDIQAEDIEEFRAMAMLQQVP